MAATDDKHNELFVELLTRHQRSLYGYLFMLVQNQADAEDLLQQTSLVLWRKFAEFDPATDFLAWACRTAHFESLNFLKARRRSRVLLSSEVVSLLAEVRLERNDHFLAQRQALDSCLDKLPEAERVLVERCYDGERSIKQVAEEAGKSANSLYLRLNHIRRRLLECITAALAAEQRL